MSRKAAARRTERRFLDEKLVYFTATADENFWDDVWTERLDDGFYELAERGRFRYIGHLYERYLPRDGRIVEAGCGLAQITLGLHRAGYRVEGVDFAPRTVERVRTLYPELSIRAGDVTRLDVPDGHYAGYISIGVIEHRLEGPEPFLDEAYRILQPGGIAIFTVPHLNPIRRWKARRGAFDGPPPTLPFYQYAFGRDELRRVMERAGFEILDWQAYDGRKGVTDEWPWASRAIKRLRKLPSIGSRFLAWLEHCRHGHMLAVVVRKPA